MAEVGISRLAISSLYSGATLAAALLLPFMGSLADRTSGGRFLGLVLLMMAGAMLLLAASTTVWLLAIALFALRLLGQGSVGLGNLTMTVRWFHRHRGRAFAIVTLGYAVGEVFFPSGILRLFEWVGWRGSLVVFAVAYAVIFAPLLFRAGRDPRPGEVASQLQTHGPVQQPSYRLGEALRTPVFYGLAAVMTLSPLILTAVIFHQVALFQGLGHGAVGAARSMVGFGLAAVAGTYLAGFLVDYMRERFAVAICLLPMAGGLIMLSYTPNWSLAPLVFGAMLGTSAGSLKTAGSLIWPAYYGAAHVGSIRGAVLTVSNGSTALGPPLAVLLAGPMEQFNLVLLPFALATLAGALLVLFMSPPERLIARDEAGASAPAPHPRAD